MINNNDQKAELVKAYIGENCDKIYGKRGNNAAFLFPTLYSFYRKLDYYGVINAVIKTVLIILACFNFKYVIFINIFIVGGINTYLFNKFYIEDVSKKVDDILLRNPNLSFDELKRICVYRGGVRKPLKIVMVLEVILAFLPSIMKLYTYYIVNGANQILTCTQYNINNVNGIDIYNDYTHDFNFSNSKVISTVDFYISEDVYDRNRVTESQMITLADYFASSSDVIKNAERTVEKNHVYYKITSNFNKTYKELKEHYEDLGYTCVSDK